MDRKQTRDQGVDAGPAGAGAGSRFPRIGQPPPSRSANDNRLDRRQWLAWLGRTYTPWAIAALAAAGLIFFWLA